MSKFIGHGTYSCVYNNPIPCSDEKSNLNYHMNPNLVGKIMTSIDASDEVQLYKDIKKIDPFNIFHIPLIDVCSFDQESLPKYDGCKYKDYRYQLILPYGKKLQPVIDNMDFILKDLIMCYNIIRAIYHMQSNDFYHFDIKQDNIIQIDNTYKLIDFGLSKLVKNTEYFSDPIFDNSYFIWPPETILLSSIGNISHQRFRQYIEHFRRERQIRGFSTKKEYDYDLYISKMIGKNRPSTKQILEKFDIYSFGITLYRRYYNYVMQYNFKDLMEAEEMGGPIDRLKKPLYIIIKKMIDIDLDKRYSPLQALNAFKQLFGKIGISNEKLKVVLTKEQLTNTFTKEIRNETSISEIKKVLENLSLSIPIEYKNIYLECISKVLKVYKDSSITPN